MIRFKARNTDPELMDDPSLDSAHIQKVLQDIHKANTWLGGTGITIGALRELIKARPKNSYTIVDVGCGDGSMLREVASFCRKNQVNARLIGIDINENSLSIARNESAAFPEIRYLKKDVLMLTPDSLECDILLCTLTMHHFSDEQIGLFLKQFASLSKTGVIINDLDRNKLAYALFVLFSRIFIKTYIARHDGLISIKSGFTRKELVTFSRSLPNMSHTIKWRWAFRYLWTMKHP
jgi:ubiquinone/menaquinone biosynthesis C-methylase UbiE